MKITAGAVYSGLGNPIKMLTPQDAGYPVHIVAEDVLVLDRDQKSGRKTDGYVKLEYLQSGDQK